MGRPVIAVTMGDAAGIGPETIVKALSKETTWRSCCPVVVGDPSVLRGICRVVRADLEFRRVESLSAANFSPPVVDVLCPVGVRIEEVPFGRIDAAMGKAAALCLEKAFEMAAAGKVSGVVSAPLNKESFRLAGYDYLDDLAFLADLTQSPEPFIVGVLDFAWTVAVTHHIPFRDIADLIKKENVLRCIVKMRHMLQKAGFGEARIAVAALNVHGGERGLFGREEIDEIGPAIKEAKQMGVNVEGPFPADTLFLRAVDEGFDGIVCMYHDQANIARKLLAKRKGATLYMGLPVVCGTTAHGTAFDKAGKGISDPSSLETALKYTAMLAETRKDSLG